MDMESKKQYLKSLQIEYVKASKPKKSSLLDEAEQRTGLSRNHITSKLSPKTNWNKAKRSRTTRSRQFSCDLIIHLVKIWDIFDQPCGQRLEPLIRDELTRLRKFGEIDISDEQAVKLIKMCPKTIDLLLRHEKEVRLLGKKYSSRKTSLLYQQIPTKISDEWDRDLIGQIQVDAVEHCGQSAIGQYINTISHTDISSHWWEGVAVIGKGQQRTLAALKTARNRFPFKWNEIHPDNGTSFINYFIYDYAISEKLDFSRSRPYKKNDNCFVEQKNNQNVRKVFGYLRYDTEKELSILNDLYENDLRLYKNFFQPIMRLEIKTRTKGHIYRKYQEAKTPYQWLMGSPNVTIEIKRSLTAIYEKLNPAMLKRTIDTKLADLVKVYDAKHQIMVETVNVKKLEKKQSKVRFLNYPTGPVRLGQLIT
jgi:hypothetical protein